MTTPSLQAAVRAGQLAAQKEHPGFRVEETGWRARLEAAGAKDPARLATLNLPDLYLAYATLQRDSLACAELDRRLVRASHAALGSRSSDASHRDEVIQLVRDRVLVEAKSGTPRLARYEGEGSLVSWLKVVALSVAIDARRREKPGRTAGDSALMHAASPEPAADQALAHARHRAAFTLAFKEATAELEAQQRLLLRMRYVDSVAIEDIGAAFSVHRTTAMRWLEKAQADLLEGTRGKLKAALGLSPRELDSLLTVMQPSLAERLSRVLLAVDRPRGSQRGSAAGRAKSSSRSHRE